MPQPRHSLYSRIAWHPVAASLFLAYAIYRLVAWGPSWLRYAGLAFCAVWFLLALFDTLTSHRLLNWLSRDDTD
jgi:hypothetical protein